MRAIKVGPKNTPRRFHNQQVALRLKQQDEAIEKQYYEQEAAK